MLDNCLIQEDSSLNNSNNRSEGDDGGEEIIKNLYLFLPYYKKLSCQDLINFHSVTTLSPSPSSPILLLSYSLLSTDILIIVMTY